MNGVVGYLAFLNFVVPFKMQIFVSLFHILEMHAYIFIMYCYCHNFVESMEYEAMVFPRWMFRKNGTLLELLFVLQLFTIMRTVITSATSFALETDERNDFHLTLATP